MVGLPKLRHGDCVHDWLVDFSSKRAWPHVRCAAWSRPLRTWSTVLNTSCS